MINAIQQKVLNLFCAVYVDTSIKISKNIANILKPIKITHVMHVKKTFQTKGALNSHTRYAHSLGPKKPRESEMCPHCGKTYKYLAFHIYKSHSDRSFKCSACDYTSPLKCYVKSHFNNVHVGKSVACDLCGKIVKNIEEHKLKG